MPAIHLTADNFDSAISSGQLVLVDFWATWCRPCQMMGPIMDQLAEDYQGSKCYHHLYFYKDYLL
jgi:thioredoxin 1